MPREHGDDGEYVETVTLDDVRAVFDEVRGPVVLSADVSDALGCSGETARRKLEALYEQGELDRRKVSRRVLYWTPRDGDPPTMDEGLPSGPGDVRREAVDDAAGTPAADDAAENADTRYESDALDAALAGWEPDTQAGASTARAQTRRAAEYLRAEGDRRTKSDFVDDLADESTLGARSWWERAVQPGLRRLEEEGVVEYRPGHHDYQWVGSDEP